MTSCASSPDMATARYAVPRTVPAILLKTAKPSLSRILSHIAKPLSILLTAIARRCTTLSTPCAMMRRLPSTRHVSTSQATVFSLWPTTPKKTTGTRIASTFCGKTLNFLHHLQVSKKFCSQRKPRPTSSQPS